MLSLSKNTVAILKNFAAIDQSIKILPGSTITSLNKFGNVYGVAVVEEEFPGEVNIYDLNQFLGVMGLFDAPEIDFLEDRMIVQSDNQRVEYLYADASVIPNTNRKMVSPSYIFSFELEDGAVSKFNKAASVLMVPKVQFISKKGKAYVRVGDPKRSLTNSFEMLVGRCEESFEHSIPIENMRLFAGAYTVNISSKNHVNFVHQTLDLKYWLASEVV